MSWIKKTMKKAENISPILIFLLALILAVVLPGYWKALGVVIFVIWMMPKEA